MMTGIVRTQKFASFVYIQHYIIMFASYPSLAKSHISIAHTLYTVLHTIAYTLTINYHSHSSFIILSGHLHNGELLRWKFMFAAMQSEGMCQI